MIFGGLLSRTLLSAKSESLETIAKPLALGGSRLRRLLYSPDHNHERVLTLDRNRTGLQSVAERGSHPITISHFQGFKLSLAVGCKRQACADITVG